MIRKTPVLRSAVTGVSVIRACSPGSKGSLAADALAGLKGSCGGYVKVLERQNHKLSMRVVSAGTQC